MNNPIAVKRLAPSLNAKNWLNQGQLSESPLNAAEHALASRLGFESVSPKLFLAAITHDSLDKSNVTFRKLAVIGSAAIKMFVTEYFYFKYPKLPAEALSKTIHEFLKESVLTSLVKFYGMEEVVLRRPKNKFSDSIMVNEILLSLIGAFYWTKGPTLTRKFIHYNFCYRGINILPMYDPILNYSWLLRNHLIRHNQPLHDFRLLAESGRLSHISTFLVGVYSGETKLGEGFGASLGLAKQAACRNAVLAIYCSEVKDPSAFLPSNVEDKDSKFVASRIEDSGLPEMRRMTVFSRRDVNKKLANVPTFEEAKEREKHNPNANK